MEYVQPIFCRIAAVICVPKDKPLPTKVTSAATGSLVLSTDELSSPALHGEYMQAVESKIANNIFIFIR